MAELQLRITLLSDTTFGRGDGVAGLVNQEIEHDPRTGLPFVKGRTIKGLLVEECANILYALEVMQSPLLEIMQRAARNLFGQPGSTLDDQGILHVGTAALPPDLQAHVRQMISAEKHSPADILETLTTIRQQTAVDYTTDTPKDNTLRAQRVVLRETVFIAPLELQFDASDDELALLAACAACVRRAGHSRNRGRGRIRVELEGPTVDYVAHFCQLVEGAA